MSPRNIFACAFVPVNTKPQSVNSSLAWALFRTNSRCKPGLETRSYDRLQTDTRPSVHTRYIGNLPTPTREAIGCVNSIPRQPNHLQTLAKRGHLSNSMPHYAS